MPATIVAKKAFVRKEDELIPFSTSPPPELVPEAEEVKVPFIPHDKYVQAEGMRLWEVEDWQSATRFIVIADTSERAIALVIEESYDGEIVELVASEILVAFENEGVVAEEY